MSNQAGEINDLGWLRHIKDNLSKNNRLRALYSRGIVWDLSRQTLRFLDRMKLACDREEDNNSAVSPIWVRTSRRSYLHFQRKRILNPPIQPTLWLIQILFITSYFWVNLFIANLTDLAYRVSRFSGLLVNFESNFIHTLLMLFTTSLGFIPAIPLLIVSCAIR